MKSQSVSIQMKTTEQYFPVVLFIMLYKVFLTYESKINPKSSPPQTTKRYSLEVPFITKHKVWP